jgi:cytoskeleton protein RodZ
MSQEDIFINGELLRLRRESRGWVLNDLATRSCMSVKQIRQLEEGGVSSFYSIAVKITAAKKVGALLGLSAEEVFEQKADAVTIDDASLSASLTQEEPIAVADEPQLASTIEEVPSAPTHSVSVSAATDEKPKTSLWLIAALFAAVLAVAAYLRPQEEALSEQSIPPLQAIPSEGADTASAAAASADASVAEPASSPASVQKAVAVAPVGSASAVVVLPSASAASKAP